MNLQDRDFIFIYANFAGGATSHINRQGNQDMADAFFEALDNGNVGSGDIMFRIKNIANDVASNVSRLADFARVQTTKYISDTVSTVIKTTIKDTINKQIDNIRNKINVVWLKSQENIK